MQVPNQPLAPARVIASVLIFTITPFLTGPLAMGQDAANPNTASPNSTSSNAVVPDAVLIDEFVFDDPPFDSCHASTVCEVSDGVVVAWFGGTREGNEDVSIYTAKRDRSGGWSKPTKVADGVQHESLRYPCWNPVLYQPPGDGPLMLFFKVGHRPSTWWGEILFSYDDGVTFTDRKRLPEGILGPVRCKPILIDGHTLICGSSTEHDGWRVHMESIEVRDGKLIEPWRRVGPINEPGEYNAIQPTVMTHPDGSLQILCRTREGVVVSSTSSDRARTWSKLQPTGLANPNSGIDAVSLSTGGQCLIYNPTDPSGRIEGDSTSWGGRGILSLAYSADGSDWRELIDLEKERRAEFSYPAIIEGADGRVHITYTHKRKRIKYLVIDPKRLDLASEN